MTQLLKKANVQPEQVGYINAHATSTQIGDRAEMQAIHSVFGSLSSLPCVSSTKVRVHPLIEEDLRAIDCWRKRFQPDFSEDKWSDESKDFVKKCLVSDVEQRASVSELMEVIVL